MNLPSDIPVSIALLLRAPKTWTPLDRENSLSHAEANALHRLVGAGMIQKRHKLRLTCEGHPSAITFCFELTGEYGLIEATTPALQQAYDLWREALDAWVASGKSLESSGRIEYLTEEWRIMEVGEAYKAHFETGNGVFVVDFIDSKGQYENRGPVRGTGRLITFEQSEKSSQPSASQVSLTNWEEGARRFAEMFGPILEAKRAAPAEHAGSSEDIRHSEDFASVYWFGTEYRFSKSQRPVVESLWRAMDNRTPSVSKEILLERSGTSGDRLDLVFRDHAAWGTMIVKDGQDTYRLNYLQK